MKKFNNIHMYKTLFFCCLGLLITSCEVEDGNIGPEGQDGIDGIDGANGNNGSDGIDGEGFDELTQFGSITLNLEGTRPDGETFTDSNVFKFTPLSPGIISEGNSVVVEESLLSFAVGRFLSAPDNDFLESGVITQLFVQNPGEANQTFSFNLGIFNYAIISEDFTFFDLTNLNGDQDLGLQNVNITNFNFDNETNALTFLFTLDISADKNSSGNDLFVSGEVDVIVLKQIQGL